MTEIWKGIEGYEDCYQVRDLVRIKSLARVVIKDNNIKNPIKRKKQDLN